MHAIAETPDNFKAVLPRAFLALYTLIYIHQYGVYYGSYYSHYSLFIRDCVLRGGRSFPRDNSALSNSSETRAFNAFN
jgi:hypothetical protein